jgi:AmmeMemoRadiSam system protein B
MWRKSCSHVGGVEMKRREEFVSGKFYPKEKDKLIDLIEKFIALESPKENNDKIIGGIVPHAGYEFSGPHAIHFFNTLKNQNIDTVIIINPSHTGYGSPISLDSNEVWSSPLGEVKLDLEFQNELELEYSENAHKYEHSGEVMIPFLKYFINSDFKIVPITMRVQNYKNAKYLARKIYEGSKKLKKKIVVVASSDFSHYVKKRIGLQLDQFAIDKILNFDSLGVENVVIKHNLSICGYGPIMTLLEYSKLVDNDSEIELLRRGDSSERYPMEEVVDYITFVVSAKK